MEKENYEMQKKQLMDSWHNRKQDGDIGFVSDGIINFDHWVNNDLKLLFFAREAYSDSDKVWDYAEWYNEGNGRVTYSKGQPFHNRINEWSYAIDAAMHSKQSINREVAIKHDYEGCRRTTLRSAVINIKKINGKSESKLKDLRSISKRDKDLMAKQLDLIKPNTILFCATFGDILKDILFEGADKIPGTERCYDKDGILLIDFFHPTRIDTNSFYWLFEDVSKIENKAKYLK